MPGSTISIFPRDESTLIISYKEKPANMPASFITTFTWKHQWGCSAPIRRSWLIYPWTLRLQNQCWMNLHTTASGANHNDFILSKRRRSLRNVQSRVHTIHWSRTVRSTWWTPDSTAPTTECRTPIVDPATIPIPRKTTISTSTLGFDTRPHCSLWWLQT